MVHWVASLYEFAGMEVLNVKGSTGGAQQSKQE